MTIGKNQYLIISSDHECCHDGEILRINDYAVLLGEGCRSFVVCSQGVYLLMLGYAVDAFCDESDEEKICTRILQNYIQNKSLLESTRSLSGRWAIFIFKNDIILAFNDACAFKQVYYLSHDGYSAFASQARYLAKVFGVEGDKEAMEYIKLAREKDNEFSWPLSCTQYKGIRRLLPNHIYNSQIKAATRDQYIPSHFKHSYLQAAREYAGILSNSLRTFFIKYFFDCSLLNLLKFL